jgi:Icc-related predicted phosphoesterase
MRLHVVSDVHGAADALARAVDGADALISLGDLALFVDYEDHSRGVFGELFGADAVAQWVGLRDAGRFADARNFVRRQFATLDGGFEARAVEAVREQYRQIFDAMPTPTYLTYGNVDLPHLYPEFLRDGLHVLDGQTVELGGLAFGFVGGGLPSVYRTPNEVDEETYANKVAALGLVDVLCSHIPPAIPELMYDTVAHRFERGSEALLDAIHGFQPRLALFGHVHQPLASRMRIGRTECVNVGHFAASRRPYVLTLDDQ